MPQQIGGQLRHDGPQFILTVTYPEGTKEFRASKIAVQRRTYQKSDGNNGVFEGLVHVFGSALNKNNKAIYNRDLLRRCVYNKQGKAESNGLAYSLRYASNNA